MDRIRIWANLWAVLSVVLAVSWPGVAAAHGAGSSVGYTLAIQSMEESVWSPVLLLVLVGYAILAGTSAVGSAKVALVFLLAGLGIGIAAARWFSPYGAISALIVGALCSVVSAARPANPPKVMLPVLAFAVGVAATLVNLDGHPPASLPFAVHFGIVFGPFALVVVVMGWIGMILQMRREVWVPILFRIFSSWSFAANAIYLAFQLKSAGL